jgi:Flp pilus assembly protein TadG
MMHFHTNGCRGLTDGPGACWFAVRGNRSGIDLHRQPSEQRLAPRAWNERRGAAVVEFAVVAPLLILLAFGIIEFGRGMMVQQVLTNGAREGARKAVLHGATTSDVNTTIDNYMSNSGITGYTKQVSPNPATASAGTGVKVTVSVPYSSVTWLPIGSVNWLKNKTLIASAEMRKEE